MEVAPWLILDLGHEKPLKGKKSVNGRCILGTWHFPLGHLHSLDISKDTAIIFFNYIELYKILHSIVLAVT